MKIYPHIITMDIDLVRKHFTTHGLRMNSKGKFKIAQKISTQIIDVTTRKKEGNQLSHHGTQKWTSDR
jgi:hypothetical protein